jgi:hypothetical protein
MEELILERQRKTLDINFVKRTGRRVAVLVLGIIHFGFERS